MSEETQVWLFGFFTGAFLAGSLMGYVAIETGRQKAYKDICNQENSMLIWRTDKPFCLNFETKEGFFILKEVK